MLILKIAGGALIIGAASLMGFFYSRREAIRESELLEMKKALTLLKNEVRFTLSPFGEAMVSVSEMVKSPVCALFAFAGADALAKNGETAADIWQRAIESVENDSYYSKEDIEAFKSLGNGASDSEAQSQSLDLLIEYIDNAVTAIRESYPKQSRMYRSLGFLGGVLITVILI